MIYSYEIFTRDYTYPEDVHTCFISHISAHARFVSVYTLFWPFTHNSGLIHHRHLRF